MAPSVVILFADALSAPEVAWSLHDAGLKVVAVMRRGTPAALRYSRHVQTCEVTDPAESVARALADVRSLLDAHRYATVMPLDDYAIWVMHRLEAERPGIVCGPRGNRALFALDKRLQLAAARRAGFAVPWTVAGVSRADLDTIATFPCIVKPALAARAVDDRLGRGRAFVIANAAEARGARSWVDEDPMLVQPHLRGTGEGLFGLRLHGRVVAWSAHRRVRMMNPGGSGSSACIAIEPDRHCRAIAERFLHDIDWQGLFMIELLRDVDGKPWFMELNGRPWGSMALARRLGLEYPAWAVQALSDPGFMPSPPPAQAPLVCRHVGRELIHLLFVARGPASSAEAGQWPKRGATVRALLQVRRGQGVYNWRKDDAAVFAADVVHTVGAQIGVVRRVRTLIPHAWSRVARRTGAVLERRRQRRLRPLGPPVSLIARARSVLFVCYGNINRSALAERHLAQVAGNAVAIRSCGFHREGRRPADPEMVSIARTKGVMLERWASRVIDADLVDASDVIFAMEAAHLVRLHAEYPSSKGRAFLLSCVTAPNVGPLEIRDPFGGTRTGYERCLDEVMTATTALAGLLGERRPVI